MSDPASKAVFLSYASQDAEAARRICETLRASGVEVWFDADGGLEHGDEWDAKIRRQIKECVLFIAVISANTQARHEGYFRIEWDLAAERARGIASGVPFILPVVIDDTREPDALVPDRFRAVQWTKLRAGEVPPDVQQRFLKLSSHRTGVLKHDAARSEMEPGRPRPGERDEGVASPTDTTRAVGRRVPAAAWLAALAVIAIAAGATFFAARKSESASPNAGAGTHSLRSGQAPSQPTSEKSPAPVVSEKSVAVLPFENRSDDKEQEYFSDGLTEEVLGALRRERDLIVPGNTSCFSFKGKNVSATEIARTLNVARLVEGSVQRVGSRVRIRVTLARPADNSSEELGTFTEELTDLFALQEKVARAVVAKLTRRTTTAPVAVLTKNPAAYDAYLRGRAIMAGGGGTSRDAVEVLKKAVDLDPAFALAWAFLAKATFDRYSRGANRSPELAAEARALIEKALELQPNLPEALIVRAEWKRLVKGDYAAALRDLEWAEALQPATAELRFYQALVARDLWQWEEAFRLSHEMVRLDPNNANNAHAHAVGIFWRKGDYAQADRLLAGADAVRENYSTSRVALRLIWRGPAAALRLSERTEAGSSAEKISRVDLLLALDRPGEARALAAGTAESDEMVSNVSRRLRHLVLLGREEEARRLAEKASASALQELERGNLGLPVQRTFIQSELILGRPEVALAALKEWRRENQRVQNGHQRVVRGALLASLFALLGQADEAIVLLRECAAIGLQFTFSLRYDPDFAPIRSDPRFQELMRQQEAWAKAQPDPVDL